MLIKKLIFLFVLPISGCLFGGTILKPSITSELIIQKPFPSNMLDNHAATIVELGSGELLTAWYAGIKEGDKSTFIWSARKIKNKWKTPKKIAGTKFLPVWNPVLYMNQGVLYLFYKEGNSLKNWISKFKYSLNEGETWSQELSLNNNLYGPAKNKPIILSNGKVLFGASDESKGWGVYLSISSDLNNWDLVGPLNNTEIYAIQPSILKYRNGNIQILARTQHNKVASAWSYDDGNSWTKLISLNASNSGLDAITTRTGKVVLALNPLSNGKSSRRKLSLLLSEQGMK